jgi:endoglycosylceramidase
MKSLGVLYIICFSLFLTYCTGSTNVHVVDSLIVDEFDRVRIYHGVNFIMKKFPWYPSELLDGNYVANLSQWGINFIRLGYVCYFLIVYCFYRSILLE